MTLIRQSDKLSETDLQKVGAGIIALQAALFFLEEIKHTKYYSRSLKKNMNLVMDELIKNEAELYDKLFDHNDEVVTGVYKDYTRVHEMLLNSGSLGSYIVIGNIIAAHQKDPKAIEGIAAKILNKKQ